VKNPKASKKHGTYHSSYCLFLLLLHQAERTRSLAATQDYIRMQKLKNRASLGSSHAIRVGTMQIVKNRREIEFASVCVSGILVEICWGSHE
jgi:hypothetical protein